MNSTHDRLARELEALQAAAKANGEGSVQALEAALVRVTSLQEVASIGPLLLLLDDHAEYDAAMFSLIHAAEMFNDAVYVPALLGVLPELRSSAPRWASIVLMRVLNSDASRAALVNKLRVASSSTKEAAKWLCEKINERSPAFLSKTLPVLLAAGTTP